MADQYNMPLNETAELLDNQEEIPIEIMPNGEIRGEGNSPSEITPSTMPKDLGGEYATVS